MNKKPRYQNKKRDYNSSGKDSAKRSNQNYRPNIEDSQNKPQTKSLNNDLRLDGNSMVCSFIILEDHDSRLTFKILENILQSNTMDGIIVSIHDKSFENTKSIILEHFNDYNNVFVFQQYDAENMLDIHNKAFETKKSDIFVITHSGIEPRPYSLDILKRYLYKENTVAVAPTVYTEDGQIQKYSTRVPTLLMQIKIILGSKIATQELTMMERGEAGYYKIHKIASTVAPFAVNSKAFRQAGKFVMTRDAQSSRFIFFKNINKLGTVLFVPNARMIEHQTPKSELCLLSKIRYFITNVF